jgi:hypothetical protein
MSALSLRPWDQFTSSIPQIQIRSPNWGISNAWLGTFKLERRYQNGFGLTIAYTYTSWIDNVVFTGGDAATFGDNQQVQNIYNMGSDRSKSTNSVPHRVVIAPIWDLPFGHGRKWGSDWNPVLDAIAGGWQFSTMGTIRTGAPFGLGLQDGSALVRHDEADGANTRPNYSPGGASMYHSSKGEPLSGVDGDNRGRYYLNEAAFMSPDEMVACCEYTLGNTSRTLPGILGPGGFEFSTRVTKKFQFKERFRLHFTWEMFNFTNTVQWNLPGQSVGGSGFGWISGNVASRRIMQFGLKLDF